jgi:capsular exopolysaccharide synthesis family protein
LVQSRRLDELRRRIDREPDPRLFTQLADELREGGDLAEAVRAAREAIDRYPDDAEVRLCLGRALLDSGDAASARGELETVLRAAPDNALARSLLDQCLEVLEEAAFVFDRAALASEPADDVLLGDSGFVFEAERPAPGSERADAKPGSRRSRRRARAALRQLASREEPVSLREPASTAPTREARRLALRDDQTGTTAVDADSDGGAGYVDFSDEGTVTPATVSPIIASLANPHSAVGEALRLLGARVQKLREERQMGCIAVTSPLPADGKSSMSLGLATALAREADQRVLLVEADLRRPSLQQTLGIPPSAGLCEWLKGELDYVPLRLVEPGGFFILVAGQEGLERPELLGSPRMDALLRAARRLFNVVLLDTVPVMPVSDTVLIQELVDALVLVVRSRQTPRDAVQDALARLRADKVLGVVLNDEEDRPGAYGSYAYGSYGMVDHSKAKRSRWARLRSHGRKPS